MRRPFLVELHRAVLEREKGPIAADADVQAGDEFTAALTDNDAAGGDDLAAEFLNAKTFTDTVASIFDAALTFFMCHKKWGLLVTVSVNRWLAQALIAVILTTVSSWRWPMVLR